ncbi:hypothetical protein SVIOM74S_05700 [Streptomyces violarus]
MVGDELADDVRRARLGVQGAVAARDLAAAVAAGHGCREGDGSEAVDAVHEAARDQPQPVLVAGPAHHQLDAGGGAALGEGLQGVARDGVAVDDDAEGGAADHRAAELAHLGLGVQQQVAVDGGEGLGGGGDLQPGGHTAHHPPYLGPLGRLGRPALEDRPPDQPLRLRGGDEGADADRPGGLTEEGDAAGVAAEGLDGLVHPGQGGDLVAQARVRGRVREQSVALHAQSVVDRDAHHAVAGEGVAVVDGDGGRAPGQGAAVQPDEDGEPGSGIGLRGPDVEVEAVVARHDRIGQVVREGLGVRGFRRGGAEGAGVVDAVPGREGHGRAEAAGAERGRRVRDAAEDRDSPLVSAAYGPVRAPDHGIRLACRHLPTSPSPRSCTGATRAPHGPPVFRCTNRLDGYLAYISVPNPSWSKPPLVVP